MRPVFALASLLAAAFLSSCAPNRTPTPYQPVGTVGRSGGFSETQLAENVYRVRFDGNYYTGAGRASDFALLRAAELCLRDDYSHFIVEDAKASEHRYQYTAPTHTNVKVKTGQYGQSTARSTTYGGQTRVITKPGHSILVVFFRTPPKDLGLVYEARFIDSSVRDKYGLSRTQPATVSPARGDAKSAS